MTLIAALPAQFPALQPALQLPSAGVDPAEKAAFAIHMQAGSVAAGHGAGADNTAGQVRKVAAQLAGDSLPRDEMNRELMTSLQSINPDENAAGIRKFSTVSTDRNIRVLVATTLAGAAVGTFNRMLKI